jgi:MSHA biogenesis protein MshJ
MNPALEKYIRTVNVLPQQIRIVALILAFGLVYSLWQTILWSPLLERKVAAQERIKTLQNEKTSLQQKLTALRISTKRSASATINTAASKTVLQPSQILTSQKISSVLTTLITTKKNLKLINLKTVPATYASAPAAMSSFAMINPTAISPANSNEATTENVVTIKFSGNFFAILSYIKNIERQNWQVLWDHLEYSVTTYPEAEVTLQIQTVNSVSG